MVSFLLSGSMAWIGWLVGWLILFLLQPDHIGSQADANTNIYNEKTWRPTERMIDRRQANKNKQKQIGI